MKTLILTTARFCIVKFNCCLIVLLFSVFSQVAAAASLPAEAQEAINKGILAGKQNDHQKAVDHFQEARKVAPNTPEIFFYLGVAESKIPRRELRAMAWFAAYLEASPESANMGKVRKQIKELDVTNKENIIHLIRAAEDAAQNFGKDRDDNLRQVAVLWASFGDSEAAIQTVDNIQNTTSKMMALGDIASAQARAGDIAVAKKTAEGIPEKAGGEWWQPDYKGLALSAIASAQAKAGDVSGAQKTAGSIPDALKHMAQANIVSAQITAGNIAGAKKTADSIQDASTRRAMQSSIASAQAKAGDIAGARITAASIDAGSYKDWAQADIAGAQAKAGDMTGARKTADSIQDDGFKATAQVNIAEGQAKAGNIAGAKKSADSIQDDGFKNTAQAYIAEAQVINNFSNLWIMQNQELLNEPVFLDITAHMKSLSSGNAQEDFDALYATAGKLIDAHRSIRHLMNSE